MGFMWLHDNYQQGKASPTLRWRLMVFWAWFVIISGMFLIIAVSCL